MFKRKKETNHLTNSFILLLKVNGCHAHQVWLTSFDHCVEGSMKLTSNNLDLTDNYNEITF